ncbi:N-6 DNA methylase [Kaistia dalseonensis]|uniref:site-specific DNA-methyltransferase (adenine-specific) n=1 Tax=Kaistia dalseonensis TaxID=410840 RepID=A0ABU0HDW2_9HYPH|nr:N-6 DNA methylase [Kaistia dalseonensis]MCX5497870.1 N-6 DNA methylase [Kaistia dalseonensis]MDQ0440514.1 hypothetical protein [Kaistia dalseonensis]
MNWGERSLAALAGAIIANDPSVHLTPGEHRLLANAPWVAPSVISETLAEIRGGRDPLGTEFCLLRAPEARRQLGATYTPATIVEAMVSWAAAEPSHPDRVVDPGVGSGRFLMEAAKHFPHAQLIGVDVDPLATLMARANAVALGFSERLAIKLVDYRQLTLPTTAGPTLFLGNPPYVRHHDIAPNWKDWFAKSAAEFGFPASKLAGLHIHFFMKTRALARPGDFGAFITAAEWLDVNYGRTLRAMLADGLGGAAVHVIDPTATPFADAMTTGAITCFKAGNRPAQLTMRAVNSLAELAPLSSGRLVEWKNLTALAKWSQFIKDEPKSHPGTMELGELFRAHRGQVTGNNSVWVASENARQVPERFKYPTVTRAAELFRSQGKLSSLALLKRVVDLPAELGDLEPHERKAVDIFLKWAAQSGAPDGYIAQHRRAWWSVGLREPAAILCTYMARQAPAFVLNEAGARHLNIAHGLYPRQQLSSKLILATLAYLRRHTSMDGGRTYAGGLVKFEPKELERIRIPTVERLYELAEEMDYRRTAERRRPGQESISA